MFRKKLPAVFIFLIAATQAYSQNVGIGSAEPQNKLQVHGSLLVTTPAITTATDPVASQVQTMTNGGTLSYVAGDSTGRIYDPGGPSGNYTANQVANTNISSQVNSIGIEITLETVGLAVGDSLIIKRTLSESSYLLAVGNGYNSIGKWTFNVNSLYIIFKSNSDGNVSSGFSLLFRRIYDNGALLPEVSSYAGNSFFFDTRKGAMRSGLAGTAGIGLFSNALGSNAAAPGLHATAIGYFSTASANNSVAIGSGANASGLVATALGNGSIASGTVATAMGNSTTASGDAATAAGKNSIAQGDQSFATGNRARALGNGSVSLGDSTTAMTPYSLAHGYKTTANGTAAVALGYLGVANGPYSFSAGHSNNASGDYAVAFGRSNLASGDNALAHGTSSRASGNFSFVLGRESLASGEYSLAFGFFDTATAAYSVALGYDNNASQTNAVAMGIYNESTGASSFSMGQSNTASGNNAVAIGSHNLSGGSSSVSLGNSNEATNNGSVAMGFSNTSTDVGSIALGVGSTASGHAAIAIGNQLVANADHSVALGNKASTNSQKGSFVFGDDALGATQLNSAAPNTFRARFSGGYRFYTTASVDNSESCLLAAGSNAWSTSSDVRLKENFAVVNGEDFLNKIAKMSLVSWNYKTQEPSQFRHYGPMAQDFYAAFGKDEYGTIGNDTTINSADFDGVNLIAIQALEKRTAIMQQQIAEENKKLKEELAAAKELLLLLQKELNKLKATAK